MLIGVDSKNAQAQFDLAIAYTSMGDAFRQSNLDIASTWYRKSIALTKQLSPLYGSGARHWLAIRDEALAEVLVKKNDARSGYACCRRRIWRGRSWQKQAHMDAFTL
jgi:hypothetical protein